MDTNYINSNNIPRILNQDEKKRLIKKYANRHFVFGIVLMIVGVTAFLLKLNDIVKEGGVPIYSQDFKVGGIFLAVTVIGLYFVSETIRRFFILKKFNVIMVDIDKIMIQNNYDGFKYVAYIQYTYSDTLNDTKVPIINEVVKDIEKSRKAKLFFIEGKAYILDKA